MCIRSLLTVSALVFMVSSAGPLAARALADTKAPAPSAAPGAGSEKTAKPNRRPLGLSEPGARDEGEVERQQEERERRFESSSSESTPDYSTSSED